MEIEINCNCIKLCVTTFDQFNVFLLNKSNQKSYLPHPNYLTTVYHFNPKWQTYKLAAQI